MAFWAPKRADPRAGDWAAVAEEFGMTAAPELADWLREHFDLGPGEISPVYRLASPGQPQVVAFDQVSVRSGPLGRVPTWRTGVVIRSDDGDARPSLRASARRHAVLEGLAAGRSGARRLDLSGHGAFDAAVSVYARDDEVVMPLLTGPVRTVLARLLTSTDAVLARGSRGARARSQRHGTGQAPSVVVGPRNLFLSLDSEEPFALAELGAAIADVLSLQVALQASTPRTPA